LRKAPQRRKTFTKVAIKKRARKFAAGVIPDLRANGGLDTKKKKKQKNKPTSRMEIADPG